jgi:glucokinase
MKSGCHSALFSVGIDIGGTKVALALVDARGTIQQRITLATEAALGFERAVERAGDAIARLLEAGRVAGPGLAGIGIGCAGPVDPARGLINNPYTLEGWNGCDIVTPLHSRFGVPVRLENDADVAALGECQAGAGRGSDRVVMLTFGTGVGGGVVLDGSIYRGAAGEHPELGHLLVRPHGPPCYCGARGCLESVASGTAMAEAGRAHGWETARELFTAADDGDSTARELVAGVVEAVVRAAWTLTHTFLPERLVLGGGIMEEHFDRFAGPIQSQLARASQFTPANVRVSKAVLGNEAGVVGAAALMVGGGSYQGW